MTLTVECENFLRSLQLLNYFSKFGSEYIILCPGSRSAPLALAAGELNRKGKIKLFNSVDERSAAFHALGISSATGKNVIVITTSGTAVANLLPAAVEADRSCLNVLFLTADRPIRLKNCGSNQTVNQEEFLLSTCKLKLSTKLVGLHQECTEDIENLAKLIYRENFINPGPIHLNIPLEKPLMVSKLNKKKTLDIFNEYYINIETKDFVEKVNFNKSEILEKIMKALNFEEPGLIIVGAYRGSTSKLSEFNNSLKIIQELTGWPVFADTISGVKSSLRGLVENWEIIISSNKNQYKFDQILRLGPLPSSKDLENFLVNFKGKHFLIKENDSRTLDPLKKAIEYEYGLKEFVDFIKEKFLKRNIKNRHLIPIAHELINEGQRIKAIIRKEVLANDQITEISLANLVPEIWPKHYPIMLSASSPIRDWLSFSGHEVLSRRCFSFRGASGIDGTLSMALGIARVLNPLLLVTGDLSFLHDINGFLNEDAKDLNLIILLINNHGGNIFNRLYKKNLKKIDIEKLFLMRRSINWENLAKTYEIPFIDVLSLKKLKEAFNWSLSKNKSVIIKVDIDTDYEINQRENIYKKILKNR